MIKTLSTLLQCILFLFLGCCSIPAALAQAYPSRPIALIVPYPPGGAVDTVARIVGKALSGDLGQPVVIENKPGGSSIIGTGYVVKQKADGYTLVLVAAHLVTNTAIGTPMPYDPLKDLEPIGNIASMPILLAISADVPAKNLQELIAWIQQQNKPVQYASPGAGTLTQLWGELLAQHFKIRLEQVAYKGSAEAVRAVMSHEMPLLFDVAGITGTMIREGKLRGILTASSQPAPGLESIPTARMAGVVELEADSFLALLGPAKMPAEVTQRLSTALIKAVQNPETANALRAAGLTPNASTPSELATMLERETHRWSAIAQAAHIRAPR